METSSKEFALAESPVGTESLVEGEQERGTTEEALS